MQNSQSPMNREIAFFTYAHQHVDQLRKLGNRGTASNHESVLNSFLSYCQNPNLPFSMITAEMMEERDKNIPLFVISKGLGHNSDIHTDISGIY